MTGASPKRYYSIAEANGRVAQLSQLFSLVLQMRAQLRTLYQLLDAEGHAPTLELSAENPIEIDPDLPSEVVRNLHVFQGMAETVHEHIDQIKPAGLQAPGDVEGLQGPELMDRMLRHAQRFDV